MAVFLIATLPALSGQPIIGTGQDEWYNIVRGLRTLYEWGDPSYFVHPALYYEILALVYGVHWIGSLVRGGLADSYSYLDYFLTHQWPFLELARQVSLIGGAAAVVAGTWLGAVLSGPTAAFVSGLLLASLPLLQTLGLSIRVDSLGLATMLTAALAIVRSQQLGNRRSFFMACVLIGVAAAANYPGAALLAVLGWLEYGRADREKSWGRRMAAAGAVSFASFLAFNPYVVLDAPAFFRWFTFVASVPLTMHPHAPEPTAWRYLQVIANQGLAVMASCLLSLTAIRRIREPLGALSIFALLYLVGFSLMRSQYDRFALPPLALLCVTGAAVFCGYPDRRKSPLFTASVCLALAPLILWSAAVGFRRETVWNESDGVDYRAEMLDWIDGNVPRQALLLIESDTLPLLQTAHDEGAADRGFERELRQAIHARHPGLPERVHKAQFVTAIYNYDPQLLDGGEVYFLASSQNREWILSNREVLEQPARFYDVVDRRGRLLHQNGGAHERLRLYRILP